MPFGLSITTFMFQKNQFQLTEYTLEKLVYELNSQVMGSDARQREELKAYKKRMIVDYINIDEFSIERMEGVLVNFPHEYFTLYLKDTMDKRSTKELWKYKASVCRLECDLSLEKTDHKIDWVPLE